MSPVTDFKKHVERDVVKIKEDEKLSDRDRELLLEFKRDLFLDDLSHSWIHKLLTHVRKSAEHLHSEVGGDLDSCSKDDLKEVVEWIQRRDGLSTATKRDYREALKRFYKWWNDGEHPEKSAWIQTTRKQRNHKLPENMLQEPEVRELIEHTRSSRDKAWISMLWETGARASEVLDLRVGSLEEKDRYKEVVISGKTGSRRLPLISCLPELNSWLKDHPDGDEPSAPLWVHYTGQNVGNKVSYRRLRKVLEEAKERIGLEKPVNPHHFRHSRATFLASKFTESQMCEWFGWVQGSDRPATYVHMSGRDVDGTYKQIHGMEEEEEPEKSDLSPEECPRCGSLNKGGAKFCQKCGLALDEKTAMEVEKKKAIGEMVMEKVEEMSTEGTLDELIEGAVEEKVKETLSKKLAD